LHTVHWFTVEINGEIGNGKCLAQAIYRVIIIVAAVSSVFALTFQGRRHFSFEVEVVTVMKGRTETAETQGGPEVKQLYL